MRLTSKPAQQQRLRQPVGWEHWDDSGLLADVRFSLAFFWRSRLLPLLGWLRYWAVALFILATVGLCGWTFVVPQTGLQHLLEPLVGLCCAGVGCLYIYLRDVRAPRATSRMTLRCPGCAWIISGRLRGWSHWWICPRCHYRARFTMGGKP